MLNPSSIAIVGASQNLDSIGGRPLAFLVKHGYRGKIFPVNPKYNEIAGFKCYPNLRIIETPIDLVIVLVNRTRVLDVLTECADMHVPNVVICSSGFAETGKDGKYLEKQIDVVRKRSGMHILGPNCQGFVNVRDRVAATFSASLDIGELRDGGACIIAQSAALGFSIFNQAYEAGVGFTYVVGTGNELDLNAADFLEYAVDDPNTKFIILHLEGIRDGKKLLAAAERAVAVGKPIIALKTGRTEAGQRAVSSHTAAMAGSDVVFEAFTKQKGIIRVSDISDLVDVAQVIDKCKVPTGKSIGVISTSGGAGVLAVDTALEIGLEVPSLNRETRAKIDAMIPEFGSSANPVDVTAQVINDSATFGEVVRALATAKEIDAIAIIISMLKGKQGVEIARAIVEESRRTAKPIGVAWIAGSTFVRDCLGILDEGGVPYFHSPARCIRALGSLMKYSVRREFISANTVKGGGSVTARENVNRDLPVHELQLRGAISEYEGKRLLERYGIPTTMEHLAATVEDAVKAAQKIGFPVVMKVNSADIRHKTESGGVRLNIRDEAEIRTAFAEIIDSCRRHCPEAKVDGVLVQEMVTNAFEVIVGIKNDRHFGPTIVFGLGGIFTEVFSDVSLRLVPVTREEALEMIAETKVGKLLLGVRGQPPYDIESLAGVLVKVSEMAVDLANVIEQVDINPLFVFSQSGGVKAADCLMVFKEESVSANDVQ